MNPTYTTVLGSQAANDATTPEVLQPAPYVALICTIARTITPVGMVQMDIGSSWRHAHRLEYTMLKNLLQELVSNP
jgi:DMSO/TMAO reductase YedYZ heme-binding membrane subunit